MSTRSPMNKRTQEQQREGGRSGMARRSAASAKPARAAASSVRVVPASSKAKRQQAARGEDLSGLSREEKRARKAEQRRREDRLYTATNVLMKEDFGYAQARRVWYVLMGAGVGLIAIAFILLSFIGEQAQGASRIAQYVVTGLAYAVIIAAFIWDFIKVRPIRNDARAKAEGMTEGRLNAVIERGASAADKRAAEREARKAARKDKKR